MGHAIPLWSAPALPVAGTSDSFPVRRIFCVGRNYAEHQKEMGGDRSEEHTSELQSRLHLVCRLLLEKKKHISTCTSTTPSGCRSCPTCSYAARCRSPSTARSSPRCSTSACVSRATTHF